MRKRKLFSLAVLFFLGTVYGIGANALCLFGAGLIWILLLRSKPFHERSRRRWRLEMIFFAAVFLGGIFHSKDCLYRRQEQIKQFSRMKWVSCEGRICKKETREGRFTYYLDNVCLTDENQKNLQGIVLLYPDPDAISDEIIIDSRVRVYGEYASFRRAPNEGNFDQKTYYESLGVFAALYVDNIVPVQKPVVCWKEELLSLRNQWADLYCDILPKEAAGVLCSVALGDKTFLDSGIREIYQDSGIAHILAVSGLHVSVVARGLYRFLRRTGRGFVCSGTLSALLLILFVQMSGMSVSAVRAAGMFLIYLIAEVLGEAYDSLTALGIIAAVLLWNNPFYAQNTGFLFSFGAVLGVCVSAVPFQKYYLVWKKRKKKNHFREYRKVRFGEKLRESSAQNFLFSLGIQLFTMPLTAYFYYEIPIYSVFVNFCILPFMPLLLALGLAAGIVSSVSVQLSGIFLIPCHWILMFYKILCETSLQLPGACQIVGKPSSAVLIFSYLCLLGALYLPMQKLYLRNVSAQKKVFCGRNLGRISLLFVSVILLVVPWPRGSEVDLLDVGQGDAVFIRSSEGIHFFVDGGSTSEEQVGHYRILPFLKQKGVRCVDYWFLSHMDTDHINGFVECVRSGFCVRQVVVTEAAMREKQEAFCEIQKLADKFGINVLVMASGDVCGTRTLSLECLSPARESTYEGSNENSMVLLLRIGNFAGLLTGDIGSRQEADLVEQGLAGKMEKASFVLLKSPHHGSDNSNSAKFLEACSPDLTVISCAKVNPYGHPGKRALVRMKEEGGKILTTMDAGQIKIRIEKRGKVWYNSLYETD